MVFYITNKDYLDYPEFCSKYAKPITSSEGLVMAYRIGKHTILHSDEFMFDNTKTRDVAYVSNNGDAIRDLAVALNKPVTFYPDVERFGFFHGEFDGAIVIGD